ncbi:unnamed protein product [Vitrella brassicaformis CCMP3155]|uniref:CCHC-type domain-containing protein n=1 Tax=Vitrella brassicaformis (strain CCMP3155) TaxID=1169540 RepID=A0A0G4H2C8_VITBC|nr:unnamed protein product [Vitrella brassicaformis CCMP3155]|eukprot:CEM37701.1 unnamed protein product [Vitrella brassicaformis CCMP3155]
MRRWWCPGRSVLLLTVSGEERAAADRVAHQTSLGAYVDQHAPQQQAGHTASSLTLPGVVVKRTAESVLERKKLKLHAFTGGQAGFPTFAFEVQSKCQAAKIAYLLNKDIRQQMRLGMGAAQYDADNAHLHAALLDALLPDKGYEGDGQALAVIQQAYTRVVNWQCDPTWNFEQALTDFLRKVQRANELRQLQGVHPINDQEKVEFFVKKLPASFGRVREAVVVDPSAKYNFETLGQGGASSSAAGVAGEVMGTAQKVTFVKIPKKKKKGKKPTSGQPTVQSGVSLKNKQMKASKDASSGAKEGNGGKTGKGKKGKGLKCFLCESTEHLYRNCPQREAGKQLLAQQMDTS